MKHNIEGFDQKKLVELGIDARGAIVLRWFVDFQPNMTTVQEDGKTYSWLRYDYVAEELPIIASNKYAVKRIFDRFIEIGLMEFYLWKNKGNYSTYRLIPETYNSLISDTLLAKVLEGSSKSARSPSSKSARTKDSSITLNPSTKSFIPPSEEDVIKYVIDKQLVINPHSFFSYYSRLDWKDNQGKQVKSWKGKAVTWDSREREKNPSALPYSSLSHRTSSAPEPEIFCCGERYSFNLGFCPQCGKSYNREGKEK